MATLIRDGNRRRARTAVGQVTVDRTRITSRDRSTDPILRMNAVPDTAAIHVVGRPGQPFVGTGAASQGPRAPALGDAGGVRLRELSFGRASKEARI